MAMESQIARSWTKTGCAWSVLYAINLPTLLFTYLLDEEEHQWSLIGMISAGALFWAIGPLMLYLSKSVFEALSEGLIATAGMQLIPILQYGICLFAMYTVDQNLALSETDWQQHVRTFLVIANSGGITFTLALLIGFAMKALRGANECHVAKR